MNTQSLQLTATERVALIERFDTEFNSDDSSSTVITFDNYDTISLVIEYDTEESSLVLSVKLESMTEKTPPKFLGCPRRLESVNSPRVMSLCEELDTLLAVEYDIDASVMEGEFTFYEWETDTGWYIYETPV